MALITCPECGREISDQATACPHCGFPVQSHIHSAKKESVARQSNKEEKSVQMEVDDVLNT